MGAWADRLQPDRYYLSWLQVAGTSAASAGRFGDLERLKWEESWSALLPLTTIQNIQNQTDEEVRRTVLTCEGKLKSVP